MGQVAHSPNYRELHPVHRSLIAMSGSSSIVTFVHCPFVTSRASNSLHRINPFCETLIISSKKGPNPLDSGLRISGCAVAQFRNEDRIKIFIETV